MWVRSLSDVITGSALRAIVRVSSTEASDPETGGEMVNTCVAAACSNTASANICLFKFPKDPSLRRQWEKQVQRTRAQWKVTDSSYLCSEHFSPDAFHPDSGIAATFGMKKRETLKPGAVPTIFIRQSTAAIPDSVGSRSN